MIHNNPEKMLSRLNIYIYIHIYIYDFLSIYVKDSAPFLFPLASMSSIT